MKPVKDQATAMKILVLHGPNLNLLGTRESTIYGSFHLDKINQLLMEQAQTQDATVDIFQSNSEGALIDKIHQSKKDGCDGMLVNLAGYTHTSVALRDAILAVELPTVEIHLSNLSKREEFRQHSLISSACIGVIMGFKHQSYLLGLTALLQHLRQAP